MRAFNRPLSLRPTKQRKLVLENLEARRLLASYIVTSVGDAPDLTLDGVCLTATGVCTLRAAIQESNALALNDTIQFQIRGIGPQSATSTWISKY